jgi:hypothetical protein
MVQPHFIEFRLLFRPRPENPFGQGHDGRRGEQAFRREEQPEPGEHKRSGRLETGADLSACPRRFVRTRTSPHVPAPSAARARDGTP